MTVGELLSILSTFHPDSVIKVWAPDEARYFYLLSVNEYANIIGYQVELEIEGS